ncbi:Hypothetical protein A7982_05435 [Minicystis rosea]|nr:Hypothetical protein A7982_05435 [Minicystis rosea]
MYGGGAFFDARCASVCRRCGARASSMTKDGSVTGLGRRFFRFGRGRSTHGRTA